MIVAQKVPNIITTPAQHARAEARRSAALDPLTDEARARVAAAELRFEMRVLCGAHLAPVTTVSSVTS